ncbi:hypothetical protein Patl1_09227 [Pistacia atlantica]|uniref:Uncharacterized protein n=1 Tax=Pistacia atlantica TaxID=434234 RepID=A0ACC1AKZ4_9ROSI|nr:hypothetical protein Patl1_09227 [Pistacia atlantica]
MINNHCMFKSRAGNEDMNSYIEKEEKIRIKRKMLSWICNFANPSLSRIHEDIVTIQLPPA